jgi:hypothetical protein
VSSNGRTPYGSRFSAGYQFPRTDAIGVQRGEAISREGPIGPWRATVAIVPMLGGRPNIYSVEAVWAGREREGSSGAISCLLEGHEPARDAYVRLLEHFKRGLAPPDAVPVPPGTPLL